MNQIINPWIFYFIELLTILKSVFYIFAIGGVLYLILLLLIEPSLSKIKKAIIITFLFLLITIIIPSETTMYRMIIANYVTYENVETATDTIKDGVDYIFEKLEGGEE